MKNVLFLGNGFSRTIFKNVPSWESLFAKTSSAIKNYTMLYEVSLLRNENIDEEKTKQDIVKEIERLTVLENVNTGVNGLHDFGKHIKENNINDIITTNYDKGIELILCDFCGYKEVENKDLHKETIYSIRTYSEYENDQIKHQIKIWKIHGEIDRTKSIMLGYDQYCGSLSKLSSYIKGTYNSRSGVSCKKNIAKKCEEDWFDGISWAELFFNANIYIVGFGMDFSEIDIWWLLNKRARVKKVLPKINNQILYVYSENYDELDKKKEVLEALEAFDVKKSGIYIDDNYINNIFKKIKA